MISAQRGEVNMPSVNCSVSNCKFWDEGNKCGADSILIEVDGHANRNYNIEAGTMVGDDQHKDRAASTAETCCHTFQPRGK